MTISIILTSHMKPTLVDAIESVLAQTRRDYTLIVVDSGAWVRSDDERSRAMRVIYTHYRSLVEWRETGEPDNLAQIACPVSWATNLAIRRGDVTGKYVCHFYDDDLMYPTFIERMAGFLDEHPEVNAVWCSQHRLALRGDAVAHTGTITADRLATPGSIDCRVDGGQVMYRREMLDLLGDPWMDENPGTCGHSDGLFLERLAAVAGGLHPLPEILLAHRATPYSTYSPS